MNNATSSSSQGSSSASSGLQPITADMFTQAMAQALQASAAATTSLPSDARPSEVLRPEELQVQMQNLRDMGFLDDAQNLRALQASSGIVQAALDLIIGGRI